jgi:hypothetical protein
MINQVDWIALPGGRHDASATRTRLTLFVSLRLEEPAACREAHDWPATMAALKFRAASDPEGVGAFTEGEGTLRRLTPTVPDSSAWKRAFGHVIERPARMTAARARSNANLLANAERMLTFDARKVAGELDQLYRKSVRMQASAILQAERPAGRLRAFDSHDMAQAALSTFAKQADVDRFGDFYRPVSTGALKADNAPFDFNQTLALLSQYPFLMRLFGVAVDFELDLPPTALPASGRIRIEPVTPIECPAASAWTAFQASALGDNVVFTARPRDAALYRDGFLALGAGSPFGLVNEDIEGQTFKIAALRRRLTLGADDGEANAPDDLPAQRAVGLTFIHSGRAAQLASTTQRALTLLASAQTAVSNGGVAGETLFLEDLCQSVRPDVKRDDREFLSLCGREVDFRLGEGADAKRYAGVADEGFVAGTVTQPDGQVRVHEALFRFDGFGLCVDRPFAAVGTEPPARAETRGLLVETSQRPLKNSLPALRYGSDYRFAVRVVDLAGGGLTLDDSARLLDAGTPTIDEALSAPVRFVRREPIGSPLVFPLVEFAPGESAEIVAVRTDIAGRSKGSLRHLLPPQVAVEITERSGMLDGMSADQAFELLGRRDRQLNETNYPAGAFREVPYLPDPLARHARLEFIGLPGQDRSIVFVVPFQQNGWPKANGVLVQLESGYEPPRVIDGSVPRVRVELPPGESATLFVQSIPDASDLSTTLLAHYGFADNPAFVAHPMLAPAREIRLVHAVERPLVAPAFASPEALPRGDSDTFVQIADQPAIDIKSTGRVTCFARWDEPVDAPPRNREEPSVPPGRARRNAEAFSFPLDASLEHVQLSDGGIDHNGDIIPNRHQLGTTGHRRVMYRLSAETRFAAFFPDSRDENRWRESDYAVVDVPNVARPAALSIRHVIPLFDWQGDEHGLGPVRFWSCNDDKPVVQRQRLGRRLRVYVERPCLLSGFEEQLGIVLWPVPLSDLERQEVDCLRMAVTQWAVDPIWKSAELPDGPFARHFPLAKTVLHGIELDEIPTLGQATDPGTKRACSVEPGRLPNRVVVAGHALHYEETADAWYADVEIDSGAAYFPFVRLALVRFQPLSQPGAHASKLTFADFAQLAPDRFLTLSYAETPRPGIEVSLVGPGYEPQAGDRPDAAIDIQLEKPGFRRTDIGWESVGDSTELARTRLSDGRMAWRGKLEIPADASGDLRIVIREFERFRDPGTDTIRQRLTFSDMVPVHGQRRWW